MAKQYQQLSGTERGQTIPAHNGKESAGHAQVDAAVSLFHFGRLQHSWERGLNEHTNGLARQ